MPRLLITAHAHEFTPAIPSIPDAYGLRIFAGVQYEDATYVQGLKKEDFTVWWMGSAAGDGAALPDLVGIYQVDEHPHKAVSEPPPPFYSIVTQFQFPSYGQNGENPARGTYVFAVRVRTFPPRGQFGAENVTIEGWALTSITMLH